MIAMIAQLLINATGVVAAFLFMYGLKRMSSPVTAPSGIFVAGVGMLAAVLASFLYAFGVDAETRPYVAVNTGLAAVALLIGGGIAFWSGRKAKMTSRPFRSSSNRRQIHPLFAISVLIRFLVS
jgi:NAD(P) transhydrogenase subunit beta